MERLTESPHFVLMIRQVRDIIRGGGGLTRLYHTGSLKMFLGHPKGGEDFACSDGRGGLQ